MCDEDCSLISKNMLSPQLSSINMSTETLPKSASSIEVERYLQTHCRLQNQCKNAKSQKQSSVEQAVFMARCSMSLMIIGVVSIIVGCGVLVTEVTAFLAESNAGPFMLGGVFAGWMFALINGSLALRAACRKPSVNKHWAKVNFGFGITTLIMHVIATIAAFFSIELNTTGCIIACYTLPLASDTPRVAMCVILCACDICQIVTVWKLMRNFSRKLPAESIATLGASSPAPSSSSSSSSTSNSTSNSRRSENERDHITVLLVKAPEGQLGSSVSAYAIPLSPEHTIQLDGKTNTNVQIFSFDQSPYNHA